MKNWQKGGDFTTINVDEAGRRAKAWGKAHGYFGAPGGYIYQTSGSDRPVCQGWAYLYKMHAAAIDAWWASRPRQKGRKDGQKTL